MTRQNNVYEYFAFVSYKREDEKWAKWLQKKLESYSLPTALRKQNPTLPNKIRPVFRDQSELSGGNLKAEIEKGLKNSKFLIVICSPRSAKSPWVSKEVQFFIDNGRSEFIIPFIIGGTPNATDPDDECFPEGLRQLKGEKELLGININEMGRDAAAIKVIARMFDIRFDVLWQRHKRSRHLRNLILAIILILIVMTIVIFAAVLFNKNNVIESQNNHLQTLVNELQEENITFSQMSSDRKLYEYVGTLRGRNEGWPLDIIAFHPSEPIVAFADSWGFWIHYLSSNVEIQLSAHGKYIEPGEFLQGIGFSKDGLNLWVSNFDTTYCFDTKSFCLLKQYDYEYNDTANEDGNGNETEDEDDGYNSYIIKYNDDSDIKYNYDGKILTVIDDNNIEIISTKMLSIEDTTIQRLKNPTFNEVLLISDSRAAIYNNKSHKFTQFFRGYDRNYFGFSQDGNYLIAENDIFERIHQTDTISELQYQRFPKQDLPTFTSNVRYNYDAHSNTLLEHNENAIFLKNGKSVKKLDVIKKYTIGNGQEYLSNALFAGPNKIIAIVEQGNIRVFNAVTLSLIGILKNFQWLDPSCIDNEQNLAHAEAFIADSKYINGRLWVLSSGGVLRIYNVEKLQTESVVILPYDSPESLRLGSLDNFHIDDDGSQIQYSFSGDSLHYYVCDLRALNKPESSKLTP